ncbi:MAG TPA: YkgJ family cysteine cluster protein [Chloroflexia bacterium]|nr:YkgJ family cysteine cluster protein [Chloroflexia bacterium]
MGTIRNAGKESNTRGQAGLLAETAREILAEHGEDPERWIIAAHETQGNIQFICATPPLPTHAGYNGPLLDQVLLSNLSLVVRLESKGHQYESLVCASTGFLARLLAENAFDQADFPSDFCEAIRPKSHSDLKLALRTALEEMLRLGYQRTATPFETPFPSTSYKLELAIKPDGSLRMRSFTSEATLEELSQELSVKAARAKLTRLRQSAKNCGGCGRCCHDTGIPLTYFDVRSVASTRYPNLYSREPQSAIGQALSQTALTHTAAGDNLLPAPLLYLRKKDGTSDGGSACVYLGKTGLCEVYEGRPLLCRLYHCAISSVALENLYRSAFDSLEWLGRAIESGALRPVRPINLPDLLQLPLIKLASPYALAKVAQEIREP